MVDRKEMQEMADRAVEIAKEMGVTLDYTQESVAYLEAILDALYNNKDAQEYDDDTLWNIACIFGAYLGECMLRNEFTDFGFTWGEDTDGEPCLVRENVPEGVSINKMVPLTKVFKRLLNGPEDSVTHFYAMCLAMVQSNPSL